MKIFVLLLILVSPNLLSHEHRYHWLGACERHKGIAVAFPECYKYQNIKKSEIFVQTAINDYYKIKDDSYNSSFNLKNKVQFFVDTKFNINVFSNCVLGDGNINHIDKALQSSINKLMSQYLSKIFLLGLKSNGQETYKINKIKEKNRKYFVSSVFINNSQKGYLNMDWVIVFKYSIPKIIDLNINQISLCNFIGSHFKMLLNFGRLDLFEKKLLEKINNLDKEYQSFYTGNIFFINPYFLLKQNNF